MKKILLSLAVIAIVAVGAFGATRSFFSDTETSTGNTFTAGAIDLTVDSTQHYNNAICVSGVWALEANGTLTVPQYPVIGSACGGSWVATDLGATNKFFSFGDIKPGDSGEDTISLHVLNNDAYACAAVSNLTNANNSTTEPESTAVGNTAGGDLQNAMVWRVWKDDGTNGGTACDNIQNGDEPTLTSGHPTNGTLALFDSVTRGGAVLAGGSTSCLGVSWSLPSASGNETQTDSLTGDISFSVVQSRNNGQFKCSEVTNPGHTDTTVIVGANNLVDSATSPTGWFLYNDQSDTIQTNSAGHQFVVGPSTPPVGTGSVEFTKTTNDKFGIATNQFAGTQLSTISALQFSTYRTAGTAAQAPSLGFDIDSNTTDGDTSYQGRLTYEPYFTHTVNTGSWQTWNTQDNAGTGNWWFSHANLSNSVASVCTQSNPCTWSELTAAYPNIAIKAAGRVILRTNGADNEVADMNTDKFVIGIGANTQTFDFGN